MQTLTCSVPSNINPLQSNGFMFSITKLPGIQFFCQEANLPGLDLPAASQMSPLVDSKHPGDKLLFSPLNIMFLIDEDMRNWKAIYNWMMGLGFPKTHTQFSDFVRTNTSSLSTGVSNITMSDAVLQILNSSNNAVASIEFMDVFPTNLSQIQLQSTTTETTYIIGQATFDYTLYQFME